MWIKTLNLIITPMVYSTLPLIHIGPDANYYWEQKMDRYLDEFIGSMMEKQVYIIKGSIISLLLTNLQLWGPFLFQIKKGQSVTLSTQKSVWAFNINNSCLPLLILTHNME